MLNNLLLTVISDDKPGIVEALAKAVSGQSGNWLESRLAQLGGKFAGVVHIAVPGENEQNLRQALIALKDNGIWVSVEEYRDTAANTEAVQTAEFHAVGPDRPGIVREITQAFSSHKINLATIETSLSSMPYSGEPLFEAEGTLELPTDLDLPHLQDALNAIADALAMDISFNPID